MFGRLGFRLALIKGWVRGWMRVLGLNRLSLVLALFWVALTMRTLMVAFTVVVCTLVFSVCSSALLDVESFRAEWMTSDKEGFLWLLNTIMPHVHVWGLLFVGLALLGSF